MNECESSFRFDLWKSSDFSCFSFIYLFSFELTFFSKEETSFDDGGNQIKHSQFHLFHQFVFLKIQLPH